MRDTAFMRTAGLLLSLVLLIAGTADAGAGSTTEDGRVQGKVDAPLTLIEYSDYTCGYCLKFFKETLPKLQATYIDTGKHEIGVGRKSEVRSQRIARSTEDEIHASGTAVF